MNELEVKFYTRLIIAVTTILCTIILSIVAYNITDRIAPIRSVQTVTVKQLLDFLYLTQPSGSWPVAGEKATMTKKFLIELDYTEDELMGIAVENGVQIQQVTDDMITKNFKEALEPWLDGVKNLTMLSD